MEHGSATSLQNQIGSQLSGQQQVKTVQSVLASVFWDAQGILFIDYFEKGRTINSEYYIALLVRLKKEIAKKRPQIKKEKVLFAKTRQHVTSWPQRWKKQYELHFELLLHPLYSPYLAPSDYWLLVDLKRMLQGKRFSSNEEVIWETEAYFEAQDNSFYKKKQQIVREALKSVYYPRRRLWIFSKSCSFICWARDLLSDVLYTCTYIYKHKQWIT